MTIRSIRFDPATQGQPGAPTSATEWYADPTGAFSAGFWSSQIWSSPVTYTEDEFCLLIEGEVALTDASGHIEHYRAGDAFVIPTGFSGTWESLTPVRKFYAIHQGKTG